MSTFAATRPLLRFAVRRDRIRVLVTALAFGAITLGALSTFTANYTTDQARQQRADLMRTPVGVIFGGPGYGLGNYTNGPMVINELLPSLLIALIIFNVLLMVRHTRTEEQTGRAELIRANAVGRRAPVTAALLSCLVADLVIGLLLSLALIGGGLPAVDSAAVGLGAALIGLSFAAVAAVFAQVVEHGGGAVGLSLLTFGALYLVRVSGDLAAPGGTAPSWVSPTSWVFQTRPYVDLRWWPLLCHLAWVAVLVPVAYLLAARRDVGAGLVAARRGRSEASRRLSGVLPLYLRLQRRHIIAWTAAAVLLGYFYGSLGSQVDDMVATNPDAVRAIGGNPAEVVDGFLATMLVYVSILASVLAIVSVSRMRAEESAGRTELVLSTPAGRLRWMGSALLIALTASTAAQFLGGAALGLSASAALGDGALAGQLIAATFNYLPVPLLFAALAALLYGLSARALPLIWLVFVASLLILLLSGVAELPGWISELSLFGLPALVPLTDVDLVPLLWMTVALVVAGALSLAAFRRRDLVSTA